MSDTPFTYTSAAGSRDGMIVMTLAGPLTLSTMFGFQSELKAMSALVLLLDMTQVPYMDSAGLGVLMNYYVAAQSAGRKFLLVGVSDRIGSLLELTGVKDILKSYASVAEAEATL